MKLRKLSAAALAVSLVAGLGWGSQLPAEAKSSVPIFKNCTELNKVYKGGVARSSSVKNVGGKTKYKPFVSQAIYDANKKSDRDKDLIACKR